MLSGILDLNFKNKKRKTYSNKQNGGLLVFYVHFVRQLSDRLYLVIIDIKLGIAYINLTMGKIYLQINSSLGINKCLIYRL